MSLPRFNRLPAKTQQTILETAKKHFAEDGFSKASYNNIILDTEISKTSFYSYFDSKEDLYLEVLYSIRKDLFKVLGDWPLADNKKQFWHELKLKSEELISYLQSHPFDLILAQEALFGSKSDEAKKWMSDLIRNGQNLGIIRKDIDIELLLLATISFFQAIDKWSLNVLKAGKSLSLDSVWSLLKGLWRPL